MTCAEAVATARASAAAWVGGTWNFSSISFIPAHRGAAA
jgi:hypothetical protein